MNHIHPHGSGGFRGRYNDIFLLLINDIGETVMMEWMSRYKGFLLLLLVLLYCVYVASTTNIKSLSEEGFVNIAAFYVGLVITTPASVVASFLPEDSGELDRVVFVFLSVVTVVVFVAYLGRLMIGGRSRGKR